MTRRVSVPALALAAALLIGMSARVQPFAQQPTLPDVLARAAQYVTAFADPSRILVCEERYTHTLLRVMINTNGGVERNPLGGHDFVAELAVAATPGDEKSGFPWLEFRDILTLDAKPAHGGGSRLGTLATQPFGVAGPEALKITKETSSARTGRLGRAVLLPRLTFLFLHAANQPRFAFKKGGERTLQGVRTWEVKYQEKTAPTIIAASNGKDAPCTGSFWVDPATGQVYLSLLKNGDSSALYAEMTVTYALDQATGLRLPASLDEKTVDTDESQEGTASGTFKQWRVVPRTAK